MSSSALSLVKEQLQATRPSFEEMNLNQLSFNKEMEYAIQIFEGNDYLLGMNPQSIKNCLVNIALSGLTLNPIMKFAYLVPRKGKCCVDPSYAGLVKIITDTGSVVSIKARVVYEKEPFEIELGSNGWVKHSIYKGAGDKGKPIGVYSNAELHNGSNHVEWMYWAEVLDIMKRSESVKKGKQSPWDTDLTEMGKKTVVKRHWKMLPKSDRAIMAAAAVDLDNQINGIDFEQEKKNKQASDPIATPKAPELALATEEDLKQLLELLDDASLPDTIFGTINKGGMKKAIQSKYDKGALEKDKADEYIKGLQEELKKAGEAK